MKSGGHSVHIFIDKPEIEQLIADLQQLAELEPGRSVRLFTESWGAGDLTEETHKDGNIITHHLSIWRV